MNNNLLGLSHLKIDFEMNFLKKLLHKNANKEITSLIKGYCPNCWGDQEYADEVREKFKDPQINVNNGEANYAFVQ